MKSVLVYPNKTSVLLDYVSYIITLLHPKMRSQITSFSTLSPLEKCVLGGKRDTYD